MPDEVNQQPQEGAEQAKPAAESVVEAEEFNKERAMATIEKLRGFEKQAKAYERKLAEFEEAEKKRQDAELSETERLKKQVAEKDAQLKTLLINDWKRDACVSAGLDLKYASRLKGETLEELKADAEEFVKDLPKAQQPKIGATNPGANATGQGETDEQRRARIYGNFNIFNPADVAKAGGGVILGKNVDNT